MPTLAFCARREVRQAKRGLVSTVDDDGQVVITVVPSSILLLLIFHPLTRNELDVLLTPVLHTGCVRAGNYVLS